MDDDWHLRGYADASKQATTPLRIDAMGDHVCLTCIDQKLDSLLGEFGFPLAQAVDQDAVRVLSMQVLQRLLREGKLPGRKVGGARYIDEHQWLAGGDELVERVLQAA